MLSKKRHVVVALTVIAMLFTIVIPSTGNKVLAEDQASDDVLALKVVDEINGTETTFSALDIAEIQEEEDLGPLNYGAANNYGTYEQYLNVKGATLDGILNRAGITLDDDSIVSFKSNDERVNNITSRELKEPRYYFPKMKNLTSTEGKSGDSTLKAGKVRVPVMISIDQSDPEKYGRLYIGQVAPNDINNPVMAKYMLNNTNGDAYGTITISNDSIAKTDASGLEIVGDEEFVPKQEVPIISTPSAFDKNSNTIYFTTDGSDPNRKTSDIYNFNKRQSINTKIFANSKLDRYEIKLMASKYGQEDSDIVTLRYSVGSVSVKVNGEIKKTFGLEELVNLQENDEYTYSCYNKAWTQSERAGIRGVTIEKLLQASGVTLSEYDDNHIITFKGEEDHPQNFTIGQLFADRYYFPNGAVDTSKGSKGTKNSRLYSSKVPALASFSDGVLHFGQEYPHENNEPAFLKGLLYNGSIDITTKSAVQLEDVSIGPSVNTIAWGSAVTLEQSKEGRIFYTTDGSDPSMASDFYNYKTEEGSEYRSILAPLTDFCEVKAVATAYGKLDSEISTKTFVTKPSSVASPKATSPNYNSVKVTWAKKTGADGYYVYRATSLNGTYSRIKTITNVATTSYTNTGLKTGTRYYYKVAAYKKDGGGVVRMGNYSSRVSALPVLKAPTSVKATASGKRKIIVTATRAAGQTGYVIYRSNYYNKGFKAIKVVRTTGNLKYTNTGLKSGRNYYYKIKSFRTVSGKNIYSGYSTRVVRKAK